MNSRRLKRYKIDNPKRRVELINFALQYDDFNQKAFDAAFSSGSEQDGMPHGTGIGHPTEQQAMIYSRYHSKCALIEKCVRLSTPEKSLQKSVFYNVTKGMSYNVLKANDMVWYERDAFYIARAKFYWELDKRL